MWSNILDVDELNVPKTQTPRISPFLAPEHEDFPSLLTELDGQIPEFLPRACAPPQPVVAPAEYRILPSDGHRAQHPNYAPMYSSHDGALLLKQESMSLDAGKKRPRAQSRKRAKPSEEMEPEQEDKGTDVLDAKRKQRLLRNRASAQLSRERKKAYLSGVEQQVERLKDENARLAARVHELTNENLVLRGALACHPVTNSFPVKGRFPAPDPATYPAGWSPEHASHSHSTSDSDKSRTSSQSRSPSPFKAGGMFFFSFLFALVFFFNLSSMPGDQATLRNSGRALMSIRAQQTPAQTHPSFFQSRGSNDVDVQPEMDIAPYVSPGAAPSAAVWSADASALQLAKYNTAEKTQAQRQEMMISAYRKMLHESFIAPDVSASRMNASYFFVPSVYSILQAKAAQGRSKHGVWAHGQVENLLPSGRDSASLNHSTATSDMPEYIVQGDLVYFWMPLSKSLWAEGDGQAGNQSLFEIGCRVHEARVLSF